MTDSAGEEASGSGRNLRFAAGLLDPDMDIPDFVSGRTEDPATKRYAVYRNNVVSGLIDGLKSAYPSLHAMMGEEVFVLAARSFIDAHPPKSAMMLRFGEDFAAFLDGFEPLARSAFLGDVARLERAWLDAYHAADAEILTGEDLADIAEPDRLQFTPHPAFAIIESNYPIADLFAYRHGEPEIQIDLDMPQTVMVTRPGLQVEMSLLTPAAHAFFKSLANGDNLGAASEAGFGLDPSFDLPGTIGLAIEKGAFVRPAAV